PAGADGNRIDCKCLILQVKALSLQAFRACAKRVCEANILIINFLTSDCIATIPSWKKQKM
ncbi:MAG: hypothetical protein K2O82_04740, partial [Alistipes sp.]|nr:hypothetical protein [Alistipes sp.]